MTRNRAEFGGLMRKFIGGWLLVAVSTAPLFAVGTSGSFLFLGTSLANTAAPVVAQPDYGAGSVSTTSSYFGFNPAGAPAPYYGNTATITNTPQATTNTLPTSSGFMFAGNFQGTTPAIAQPGMPAGNFGGAAMGSGTSYGFGGTTVSSSGFLFAGPVFLTTQAPAAGPILFDGPLDNPEPATIALMGGGIAVLAFMRRRMLQKREG